MVMDYLEYFKKHRVSFLAIIGRVQVENQTFSIYPRMTSGFFRISYQAFRNLSSHSYARDLANFGNE
jgi:hypothetical protein